MKGKDRHDAPPTPFFDDLTTPGPDLAPAPDLAESWTVNEDHLQTTSGRHLGDARVRKTLSYAINRQAIVDAVWQGRATIHNSPFPYDWWPTKKDTALFDNDPDQARALVDEAGWVIGGDGIREKDGLRFSFTFYTNHDDWPPIVQQQWKDVGIERTRDSSLRLRMTGFEGQNGEAAAPTHVIPPPTSLPTPSF